MANISNKSAESHGDRRGWIKLYRKIEYFQYSPANEGRRFTKYEAWIDLILHASYKDHVCGGIRVQRGQLLTSIVRLAKDWKWNRRTVSRYLKCLEYGSDICTAKTNRFTLITICKYDAYQGNLDEPTSISAQQSAQQSTQQSAHQSTHNKEVKNSKEVLPSRKKRSAPHPDHKAAVKYFCDQHRIKTGLKYNFKGGEDGKHIQWLLEHYTFEEFKKMADYFLAGNDSYTAKKGLFHIGMLKSKSGEYAMLLWGNIPKGYENKSNNGGRSSAVPY